MTAEDQAARAAPESASARCEQPESLPETLAPEEAQDVFADYGVARAFSLAASILDAGEAGLTKAQIRGRVEHYRSQSEEQSGQAWERLFSRDKDHLRSCGISITEPAAENEDHRYRIDPADYGLPALQLEAAETLVLARAGQLWGGGRARSWLEQASWALSGASADRQPSPSVQPLGALQLNLGSDAEFDRLTELAALTPGKVIGFDYTARGASRPQPRRVALFGYAARGHWYLLGHDLDRDASRVFRLDRIHGTIRALKPQPELSTTQRDRISAAREIDLAAELAGLDAEQDPATRLRDVLAAHEGPAPRPPRLAAAAPSRRADPAQSKVERIFSMASYLLGSGGARPSELLRRHQITPKQLLRDLLSIQQSGSFGPGQYGEFIDVHPVPPLTLREFTEDYLTADEPITLSMPSQRTDDVLARPLTLTKPGALSLLIALNTMISTGEQQADPWLPAARTLREKVTSVLPGGLQRTATQVAAISATQTRETSQLQQAVQGGWCLEIDYEDAAGVTSRRVVEPAHLYIDGPRTYFQAWCRTAQGPRNFLSSRITRLRTLPEVPVGAEAARLARSPAEPPQPPRGSGAFDVLLRFSPAAAALADRYVPQRQKTHTDGARTISTWFQSREALIRLCLQLGGDLTVLAPAEIREAVRDRAQAELSMLTRAVA